MTRESDVGVPVRARRRQRRWERVLVAVGLVLVAGTLIAGWKITRGVAEFGVPPAVPDQAPAAVGDPAPSGDSGIRITPGGLPGPVAVAPVRLRIPTVKLDAAVKPVGVDRRTGEVAVPESVSTVGWYRHGPGLDAYQGSMVIAGHLDSATEGAGVFAKLARLRPGAKVTLYGADGRVRQFEVVAREVFGKSAAPYQRLFSRAGPLRLTLVTCGGDFDRRTGSYRDNVVVTAVPIGTPDRSRAFRLPVN